MNGSSQKREHQKPGVILPVVLRISFRVLLFILWTTFAATAFAQTREQRVVKEFPVDRAAIENLQRWVDGGHDTWCRQAAFVATATLRRLAPEIEGGYELTSSSLEREHQNKTRAVYVYHSLDGRASYRITVRRYRGIWVPEGAEIVSKATTQD